MGIQEQHDEHTPTDPDSTLPKAGGGASPGSSPGGSLCSSCSRRRSVVRVLHFGGILGFLGYLTPWATSVYTADWKPMAGIGACLVMLITRASIWDVVGAAVKGAKELLPWGKGGKG
jgi:hypothetical protein